MNTRRKIIAGNWKMYKTLPEAQDFLNKIVLPLDEIQNEEVPPLFVLAVPFTLIAQLAPLAEEKGVAIAAQNMHDATEGAFTGEIGASMLLDAGAKIVLLGHSERRQFFHEEDSFIHKKLKRALATGIFPILCIGETLEEQEQGLTQEVLKRQLSSALQGLTFSDPHSFAIAYEPIWAIGTGKAATAAQADQAHAMCRQTLKDLQHENIADKISILYGGSVKPENAEELLSQSNIDGVLVGGASLKSDSFSVIAASLPFNKPSPTDESSTLQEITQ